MSDGLIDVIQVAGDAALIAGVITMTVANRYTMKRASDSVADLYKRVRDLEQRESNR